MIAFLRGKFLHKTPSSVLMDVHGVGYEVLISLQTYVQIERQDQGMLYIHHHFRDDGQTLFGFADTREKELFVQLISVSGVGAATARIMLSSLKPDEIAGAIVQGNTRLLEGIKGIGRKSAERIVLELKDKMAKTAPGSNISPLIHNSLEQDALNALIALGIPRTGAEQAIQKVKMAEPDLSQVEEIIKKALKNM